MLRSLFCYPLAGILLAACATTQTADHCEVSVGGALDTAITSMEERLDDGCEHRFYDYFQVLLTLASENPDPKNPEAFSDHLIRAHDSGVISRRQAEALYNRYFNVKFVSLRGDYNTCTQTCPVRAQVMSDMRAELHDKELGLLRASADQEGYYRADSLLIEADLVLEATCRACAAGDG